MPLQPSSLELDIAEFDQRCVLVWILVRAIHRQPDPPCCSWRRLGSTRFTLEDSPFNPHDFGVTSRFYVFAQHPMRLNLLPYLLGFKGPAQVVEFAPGRPMKASPWGVAFPMGS